MDKQSQLKLEGLLRKQPFDLTEPDKAFLKSRWAYVGKRSRQKFGPLFEKKGK